MSILHKSIAGRYRPVSYPDRVADGSITARYRFMPAGLLVFKRQCESRMDYIANIYYITATNVVPSMSGILLK